MIFWASAEVFQPAYDGQLKVRLNVESYLNAALSSSSLKSLEGKLRYVPIIMPDDMRQRYPARSKILKRQKIYDCAPQLNYEVFLHGTFEEQLREYLRGIYLSVPFLRDLGASAEQTEEFQAILNGAVEKILIEQPAESRH